MYIRWCLLRIIKRQTRMAARAPIENLRTWPSWMVSQFSPQKPSGQIQWYRNVGSLFIHVPPLRHGKSKHSSRSIQPLLSGDVIWPSPHLSGINVNGVKLLQWLKKLFITSKTWYIELNTTQIFFKKSADKIGRFYRYIELNTTYWNLTFIRIKILFNFYYLKEYTCQISTHSGHINFK